MRPRFSLRHLLILFTIIALLGGLAGRYLWNIRNQVRRQNAAVAKLEQSGARLSGANLKRDADDPAVQFARKWIEASAKEVRRTVELSPKGQILSQAQAEDRLTALGDIHGVETISLKVAQITPQLLERLRAFPRLNSLSLTATSMDREAAKQFAQLKSLSTLHVICPVTDEFALAMSQLPRLDQLTIDASLLSAQGQESLAKCPKLTGLSITGKLKGSSLFAKLGARGKLGSLNLWRCELDREATDAIGSLKDLVRLTLHDHTHAKGDITVALAQLPKLTDLLLRPEHPLSDEQIARLATLTQLVELDLTYSVLIEKQLQAFAQVKRLTKIEFRGELSDQAIESFLKAAPPGCLAIQLTTQKIEMVGKKYSLKAGDLLVEDWPEIITGLSRSDD
jgi:hypothetical protein